MEEESKEKIEKTVREILKESDMTEMTEFKVRNLASERLGIDLSEKSHKAYVRTIVKSFLEEEECKEQHEKKDEEEVEEEEHGRKGNKEFDDDGDLIICRLSDKRRVTIQEFRGKTLVSIREYYKKDGKELPTSKVDSSLTLKKMMSSLPEEKKDYYEEAKTDNLFDIKKILNKSNPDLVHSQDSSPIGSNMDRSDTEDDFLSDRDYVTGISLTDEQWSTFKKNIPAIEKAVKKMESRV